MSAEYVVVPRDALLEFFGRMALPPWRDEKGVNIGTRIDCAPIAQEIAQWVDDNDLSSVYPLGPASVDASGEGFA